MSCTNNLKQIGLGLHNYHDVQGAFPCATSGGWTTPGGINVQHGWSANVPLLPYCEQQAVYDLVFSIAASPDTADTPVPWITQIPYLACPSDANVGIPMYQKNSKTSYAASYGDTLAGVVFEDSPAWVFYKNNRGFFSGDYQFNKFSSLTDGSSNTIAYSERCTASSATGKDIKGNIASADAPIIPANCFARKSGITFTGDATDAGHFTNGSTWSYGPPYMQAFQTILPPNSPSCMKTTASHEALYSAVSKHPGGVNAAYGDGSIHFVSETINARTSGLSSDPFTTGDDVTSGISPYGVWGALGSIAGGESVSP